MKIGAVRSFCFGSSFLPACGRQAEAGIQDFSLRVLDSRFHGNDTIEYFFKELKCYKGAIFENSKLNTPQMNDLHPWEVNVEEAIQIQEHLRGRLILEKTFSEVKAIGGADVAYSKEKGLLFGAITVLSFPDLDTVDMATAEGEISFPYISGLLGFREGPVLINAFRKLKIKPDVMIYEGQGIAHPRGFGLASHLGLWLDLPAIGCTKTPLLREFISPGPLKGSLEVIRKKGMEVGAVLRTKEKVKPLFVSPGHRIDLQTSIQLILQTCQKFRMPEPLRRAHHTAVLLRRTASTKLQASNHK